MGEVRSRLALRSGLTLVEVCLVLALLVVIAALAAPLMEGAISHAALHGGGDLVRSAWAKARLAAMENGQIYVFRFEPNGSRYQVITFERLALPESNALAAENPDAVPEPADLLRLRQARLPEGVTFHAGDVASSSQVEAVVGDLSGGPWSQPILFNADGTTSDASLVLTNDREQSLRLTLRGLTGTATIGDAELEATP
jgi:hypothetical protein